MTKKKPTCFLGACKQPVDHEGLHDGPKKHAAKVARMRAGEKRKKGYKPPPRCRACRRLRCVSCGNLRRVKGFEAIDKEHCEKHCPNKKERHRLPPSGLRVMDGIEL